MVFRSLCWPDLNMIICPTCRYAVAFLGVFRSRPSPWLMRFCRDLSHSSRQKPKRKVLASLHELQRPSTRAKNDRQLAGMNRSHWGSEKRNPVNSRANLRPWETRHRHVDKSVQKATGPQMRARRARSVLSEIPYTYRAAVKSSIIKGKNFDDFQLLPSILTCLHSEALADQSSISPTAIQRLAVPILLSDQTSLNPGSGGGEMVESMRSYLLAAETGSGKTLAYLLPTVDALKRKEIAEQSASNMNNTVMREQDNYIWTFEDTVVHQSGLPGSPPDQQRFRRPRAIILLPTAELVDQVGAAFKMFSHTVKLRVALLSASYSATVIRNRLFAADGTDIIVATPHILSSITESDPSILSHVEHLVVDEADSLLDRSFAPLTTNIIDRAKPSLQRLLLCSATIPRSLDEYLRKRFPDIVRLVTPNVHAIPRRVQLNTVDVERLPYHGNRDLACADIIWSLCREDMKEHGGVPLSHEPQAVAKSCIIVFVNSRETVSKLTDYLRAKGLNAFALNRDMSDERKDSPLSAFTTKWLGDKRTHNSGPSRDTEAGADANTGRTLQGIKVVVMTDIGSRGIDTVNVRYVILYDVPHTTIDFIHRLGRAGRMGRRGRGFVLLGKHDRKDIVREVREGMYRGQALM